MVKFLVLFSGVGLQITTEEKLLCLLLYLVYFFNYHYIGNTLCIFGLGFSKNYYLSLLFRFIHGVVDGSLGVCKTIMADLSNDRNIAIGTGFLFVGSTIGGYFNFNFMSIE